MTRIRKALGLLLAILTVLSLFPMTALAEEAQPYESVEHPSAGVTVYHNKDGTDTMVVEPVTAEEAADADPDRLMSAGGFLVNEGTAVDLKIEKEFNEGETLVTVGIDGASVSFYPLVPDAPAPIATPANTPASEIIGGMITAFVDRKDSNTPIATITVPAGTLLGSIEFPHSILVKLDGVEADYRLPVKGWHAQTGVFGDESGSWRFVPEWDAAFVLSDELKAQLIGDPATEADDDPFVVPFVLVEMQAATPAPSVTPDGTTTPFPAESADETPASSVTPSPTIAPEISSEPEHTTSKQAEGSQTLRLSWHKPLAIISEEATAEPTVTPDVTTPQPETTTPIATLNTTAESVATPTPETLVWGGPGSVDGRLRGYSDGTYAAVVYKGVFSENTDIELRALQSGVKENILIGEYTSNHVYAYRMNFSGLTPVLSGHTVKLYSAGKQVGQIDAPYMVDSRGSASSDIDVALNALGGGAYELVYTPSDSWLNSDMRVYPVTLDPTLTFTGTTTYHMEDNHVDSNNPDINFTYNAASIRAGGTYTAYLRPVIVDDLNTNASRSLILNANINLYCNSGSGSLNAYLVDGTWSSHSITYNNAPGYSTYISGRSVGGGYNTWDITSAFAKWFHVLDQKVNGGVALTGSGNSVFASADTPNHRMYYSVTYYRIDEANTLTASPVKNTDGTGTVNLSWSAIPNASSYYIGIYNGKEYEYINVGNVTSWSTSGKGIWPTSAEIAAGRYVLHLDGTGAELPASPLSTYKNANASSSSLAYYFTVLPTSSFGQAANPGFTASAVMPHALVPAQPTSVLASPSNWTNAGTASISWSGVVDYLADGTQLTTLETGGRIEYSVDGVSSWQTTGQNTASGTYILDTSALSDGTHTVYIRGVDKDGNEGAPRGAQIKIDRTAPTAPSVNVVPDDWTNGTSVTINWSGISDLSGISRVEYSVDGLSWISSGSALDSDTKSLDISGNTEGTHGVRVRAIDLAGNAGQVGETSYYKDTKAPTADSFIATPASWTDADTVNIAWTNLTDTHAGLASLEYSVDGSAYTALDHTLASGNVDLDASVMADGTHSAVFRYTDNAGNTGTTTVSFYRDTQAPALSLAQPLKLDLVNGIVNVTGTVEDLALSGWKLSATGTGGEVVISSGTTAIDNALLGVLDTSAFADGEEITLKLTATDKAGHTTTIDDVVITVDRSLVSIPGSVTITTPVSGAVITTPETGASYTKTYAGTEQTGYAYLDGKLLGETSYGTFDFSNILLAEGSSHTISVISQDTTGVLHYSDGMGLYGLGSGAPEEATGTVESGALTSPKSILALRLTTTQSASTGIVYSISEDGGATWRTIVPDQDIRLLSETKSVLLKSELNGTSTLHGWALSAIVEKNPTTVTVRLNGSVTPFAMTHGDTLTQSPVEAISTDLPTSGITTYALFADGVKTSDTLAYETLLTPEGGSVTLSALALDSAGAIYGSGAANVTQLLRTSVSEPGTTYESGELTAAQPISAIRFLATTTGSGCTYFYSLDGTNWTSATAGQYILLNQATAKLYFRAEQTATAKLTGLYLEGISITGKNMTVRLVQAPGNVVVKDYGKYAEKRNVLSWTASASADANTEYVIYRNGTKLATTTQLSYTDSDYLSGATYTVSLKKTFTAPDAIASHVHILQRESVKIAAKKVVLTPPETTQGEDNDLIDFADVDTLRELYGDTYLFTQDMLTPPASDLLDQATLGKYKHCSIGFEPVNFNTGNFFLQASDIQLADIGGALEILRTYNTQSSVADGPFGKGWEFAYSQKLELYADGNIGYRAADGTLTVFKPKGDGTYSGGEEMHRTLTADRKTQEYRVAEQDKSASVFTMQLGWLKRVEDKYGNAITIERAESGYMSAIVTKSGKRLALAMDENGHITQITLPDGGLLSYAYAGDNLVSFTDALGNKTRYVYDRLGRMTEWYDAAGTQQVKNTYDTSDRVIFQTDAQKGEYTLTYGEGETTSTDALGQTSKVYFDAQFRTTEEIDALGNSTRYYYDTAGNLVGTTDAYGKLTSSEYDARGNQIKNILPDGSASSKTFNENNQLTSYTDGNGNTTSYTYDSQGNLLSTTGAAGGKTTYAYNDKGQMLSTTDAAGNTTKFEYDGANMVKTTDALGNETQLAYDALGQMVRSTDALGDTTRYTYDANGNLLALTLPNGAETTYTYDALGNVISSTDPLGNVTTFEYDTLSRLVQTTFADGTTQTAEYDYNGNIVKATDTLGNVTSATYDKAGNRTSSTDAAGNTTTYAYDKRNRLMKETLPTGAFRSYVYNLETGLVDESTDEFGITTQYQYDKAGNLVQRTLANGATYITKFDAENRAIQQVDPLGNAASVEYDLTGRVVSATSVLGGVTKYAYDANGNLVSTTDALGNSTRTEYDALGRIVKSIDALGNETRYAYDKAGNLASVTDALGNTESYQYDKSANLTKLTDALGQSMSFGYDALGGMTKAVQKNGAVTVSEYDAEGRLMRQTDALGNATTYAYNTLGLAETVTDALGQTAKIAYDALGNPLSITAPNGGVTKYAYAASGQLLSTTNAIGLKTSYAYDAVGNVSAMTQNGNETQYAYDLAGNVIALTDAEGRKAEFAYDAAGNLLATTYPDGSQSTAEYDLLGRVIKTTPRGSLPTTYVYDANGNLLSETTGTKVTSYTYDALGNRTKVTYADGTSETYAYDALGNLIGSTDALGAQTKYAYDASSLLSQVTYANGATLSIDYDKAGNITAETDALGAKQTYAYDAVGRMSAVTDALGNVTQYAYDAGDNLAEVTDANGNGTSYTYDLSGNLTSETDALGNTIRYAYTPEGWLSKITKADGETITYAYDKTGNLLTEECAGISKTENTYNEIGKLVTTTSAEGETKYQYDDQGNLIYVKTPNNEVVSYTYDEYGRKESMRYPDGKTVFYAYDQMDRLIAVRGLDGTKTEYSYNAAGQRTQTDDGKLTTEYGYDVVGNLTKQKTIGRTEISFEYLYDLNNRMVSETRNESGATVKSEYVYDKLGQIQSFQTSEGYEEAYTYDAAGNMTQKSVNGLAISMTYNAANELKTMQSEKGKINYSYDANGNLTQKELDGKKDIYTYDTLNRLTSYVGYDGYTQNYTYNAQSMMSARETKGNPNRQTMEEIVSGKKEEPSADDDDPDPAEWVKTSYTYDVTAPYYEVLTEMTNGVTTAYEYGIERISAYEKLSISTQKTNYAYDGRGSVAQTLTYNSSWYTFGGTLAKKTVESYTYTPFGEILRGTTSKTTNYAYNGESYDSAIGMVNLRARWYEPATMRFSQRDIWHGAQIIATTQNRYLYCINDPINLFDYSGEMITGMHAGVRLPISKPLVDQTKKNPGLKKTIADSVAKLAAQISTGIDKSGLNDAQIRVVEEAEKELFDKAINGTLSDSERSRIIKGACTAVTLYDGGFHISGDSVYWDGVKYPLSKPSTITENWEVVYQKQLEDYSFNVAKGLAGMSAEGYDNPNSAKWLSGVNGLEFGFNFVISASETKYADVQLFERGDDKQAVILLADSDNFTKYAQIDFDGDSSYTYSAWVEQYGTYGMQMINQAAREEYESATREKSKWWLTYDYLITIDAQHKNELYSQYLIRESNGDLVVETITYPNDKVVIVERTWLGLGFNQLKDVSDRLAGEETLIGGKDDFEKWMAGD